MKEIIQSILPVISAFLGAVLTFYFQKKLTSKQLEIKKQIIIFEKKREDLSELKSYQTTIVHALTALQKLTTDFSKNKITEEEYKELTKHKIVFLEDILSKAQTLYNKQLDFYVVGLTVLYQNIENTLKITLKNDEYNSSANIDNKIKDYDYLIVQSKNLSEKIIKIAKKEC